MSREIELRAYDLRAKVIIPQVELTLTGVVRFYHSTGKKVYGENPSDWPKHIAGNYNPNPCIYSHFILSQFTGFYDHKKKKIWERNKIAIKLGEEMGNEVVEATVVWRDGSFELDSDDEIFQYMLLHVALQNKVEVIGEKWDD